MGENAEIRLGANVVQGQVTCQGVAKAFGLPYTPIEELLQAASAGARAIN